MLIDVPRSPLDALTEQNIANSGYVQMEVKRMKIVRKLNPKNVNIDISLEEIGNYNLGYISENGEFIVKYVGRSDTCLQRRLKKWAISSNYSHYTFRLAMTIKQCYEIECREYHLLSKQLDNEIHPGRPRFLPNFRCPWCPQNMEIPSRLFILNRSDI